MLRASQKDCLAKNQPITTAEQFFLHILTDVINSEMWVNFCLNQSIFTVSTALTAAGNGQSKTKDELHKMTNEHEFGLNERRDKPISTSSTMIDYTSPRVRVA